MIRGFVILPGFRMAEPLPLHDAPLPARPKRRLARRLLLVAACLLVAAGTFAGLRYRAAAVPGFAYREFAEAGGPCRARLVGDAEEAPVDFPAGFHAIRGGKRFVATHWSTPVTSEVRWLDLEAEFAALLRSEDVIAAEVARRARELGATVEAEATVRLDDFPGREVRFAAGRVKTVERYVMVKTGPRPRLYAVGVGGGGLDPDAEAVRKVLGSLQVR